MFPYRVVSQLAPFLPIGRQRTLAVCADQSGRPLVVLHAANSIPMGPRVNFYFLLSVAFFFPTGDCFAAR
jgi:hypothetical protein